MNYKAKCDGAEIVSQNFKATGITLVQVGKQPQAKRLTYRGKVSLRGYMVTVVDWQHYIGS